MKNKIRKLTSTAVFAAALCVIAPWSVPVGAVPVSLASAAVYLTAVILERGSAAAVTVYIAIGLAGMPVFAGFSGGAGVLTGPTGGFLIGYIPAAFLCGWITERFGDSSRYRIPVTLAACLAAAAVMYACGTAWYTILTGRTFREAAAVCILPFLVPEAVKIAAAVLLGERMRSGMKLSER